MKLFIEEVTKFVGIIVVSTVVGFLLLGVIGAMIGLVIGLIIALGI